MGLNFNDIFKHYLLKQNPKKSQPTILTILLFSIAVGPSLKLCTYVLLLQLPKLEMAEGFQTVLFSRLSLDSSARVLEFGVIVFSGAITVRFFPTRIKFCFVFTSFINAQSSSLSKWSPSEQSAKTFPTSIKTSGT